MIQSMPRAVARNSLATLVFAAAAAFGTMLLPQSAQALTANPNVTAPQLTETIACRTVRSQVVRPGGRVTYRTRTVCTPMVRPRPRCTMERQRIVRPNGAVVFKSIRRCR